MSLSSQSREALISVRLVVADHYMAAPVPGLDPLVSPFTGAAIKRLPVIRVFGSTVSGQRACLHLHGIFPYIYVPMPENEKVTFEEFNFILKFHIHSGWLGVQTLCQPGQGH